MTDDSTVHESSHAKQVAQRLRERITAAGGWLPFDAYMQIALYEPGLGYYSAGSHKLGAGGDFTTAPEISPLFGQCLAHHCMEVLADTPDSDVLEIGAGSGRLAFDVLQAMAAAGHPPSSYRILEVSADLRQRQQQLLATLPPSLAQRVEWLDRPPQQAWTGALLANEVLDALPVQRFIRQQGQWQSLGVAISDADELCWQPRAADALLAGALGELALPAEHCDGYESELCLMLAPWLKDVTAQLRRGVALFVDYGLPRHEYYSAARDRGTLRCHYRQRAHDDPFAHPGMEDITAWVDFTRVAEAADACGMSVLGYATQAAALLGLGIESLVSAAPDEPTRIRRASEARQLLMPTELGETFKVMALGRDFDAPLSVFHHQDLRSRL
jgi:SAM-dependent MidA family methyltransferase